MKLSQDRTRAMLDFCRGVDNTEWTRFKITAVGMGASHFMDKAGKETPKIEEEDKDRSRRVEFKVRLDGDKKMREIIDALNKTFPEQKKR